MFSRYKKPGASKPGANQKLHAVPGTGGTAGKRYVLPNSRILLHQPLMGGTLQGAATDLAIEAEEIIRVRQDLYRILAQHTGKEEKQIEADCDRNLWLNSEQAIEYGLVDSVLDRMPEASGEAEDASE